MEQSNSKIGEVLKMKLDHNIPSIPFKQVWSNYKSRSRKILGLRRVIAIPSMAIISLLVLGLVGFKFTAIEDNIDYPFVNDQQVIGKWQAVDFVADIDDFSPDKKTEKGDLFLKELVFIKDGQMLTALNNGNGKLGPTIWTWTQGLVLSRLDKTASTYEIKKVNGSTYMFFQAKSGEYIYFHMQPHYYVLQKVDNADYSDYKLTRIEDKVDYPFVDDPLVVGTWETVDCVKTINEFDPDVTRWFGRFFLKQLNIGADGKLSGLTSDGLIPEGYLTWTNGFILDKRDKTAGKYEVQELKGDIYLFFEWKSGDYAYREMEPEYFVLRKVR